MNLLKQMRVKEWVKNLFIFLPIFFAGRMNSAESIKTLSIGFFAFCFLASCIYCINDFADLPQDKEHPIKQQRPFASGLISAGQLWCIAAACLGIACLLSTFLARDGRFILMVYFVLQLVYTFFLKHLAVIDCVCIALGFVLRILFGGLMLGFVGSSWILLLTFLLSLYLAFAKRRSELATIGQQQSRPSLKHYSLPFLDAALAVTCSVTIVAYIMYTHDAEVTARIKFQYFYVGSVFVVVGMLRHLQQTVMQNKTESPTDFLLKDPIILITIAFWLAFNAFVLY